MLNKLKANIRQKLKLAVVEETKARIDELHHRLTNLENKLAEQEFYFTKVTGHMQMALGRIEIRQLMGIKSKNIHDNEAQIFSQWGEDGIIQYLIRKLNIQDRRFIEFGVEDYQESNTRFLLINNNWSGLVFDASEANIERLKNSELYWKYDLIAKRAFINKDNVNKLIKGAGFAGEIGLLSIDIDGNDYWVWEAIDVVIPAIVIIEYNSRFGSDEAVTIPYNKNFVRQKAHYSMLYAGASLPALYDLAQQKGYFFIGTNSAGNNAFFVHKKYIGKLKALSLKEGFVAGKFREARDKKGHLSFITREEEEKILSKLPLVKIDSTKSRKNKS